MPQGRGILAEWGEQRHWRCSARAGPDATGPPVGGLTQAVLRSGLLWLQAQAPGPWVSSSPAGSPRINGVLRLPG